MKWEHWIAIVFVLLIAALGGMAGLNTVVGRQQAELAARALEKAALEAQVADLQDQLRPPPYYEPLEGAHISSGCGYRVSPMGGGTEGLHHGTDFTAPIGTPVKAARDGIIKEHWVPPDGGRWTGHPVYGGLLVVDHGEFFGKYGHLSKTFVHEGDHVKMGQIIGLVGNTGISTGSHLHFETVVDPLKYLGVIR